MKSSRGELMSCLLSLSDDWVTIRVWCILEPWLMLMGERKNMSSSESTISQLTSGSLPPFLAGLVSNCSIDESVLMALSAVTKLSSCFNAILFCFDSVPLRSGPKKRA